MTAVTPCDFKDQVTGEVSIPSSWQREVAMVECGTQTMPLKTKEQEVQTMVSSLLAGSEAQERLDKATETVGPQVGQASLVSLQYVYRNAAAYDEEKLATFLESHRDQLQSILSKSAKGSSVFEHYRPNWWRRRRELSSVLTLASPHAIDGDLHALDVAWNAAGSMLAVALGRMDASGWCYSSGYVCIWNLMRGDFDTDNPHYSLETDSFATALAFHPQNSLTLAVGTYSGSIVIFPSVAEAVPTEISSIGSGSSVQHTEPVSKLQWVSNPQEVRQSHRFLLCSAALDGQVVYWSVANKSLTAVVAMSARNRRHVAVGATALAFLHQEQAALGVKGVRVPAMGSTLLVGFESGEVGRAQPPVALPTEAAAVASASPLALEWMVGHRGPVRAMSASPFFRHLFATCSSDGAAHVRSDLERAPLLTLEPSADSRHFLYDLQFSPFRPSVLAIASRSSHLLLYDLQTSPTKPVYAMEAGTDGSAVTSLSFSNASPDWLATGDMRGRVRVWRLPSDLSQATEQERAAVRLEQHAGGSEDAAGDNAKAALRQLFGFSL